uniref:Biotin biosynthesis protein BioY n=1 Tax=Glaucocystis sp. BBH TaxID=2023628 RepID=A0A3G1IUZ0_9EUKA|nr:biotin biosynthesis protein BioY [Glaucocystis sp. BBH]
MPNDIWSISCLLLLITSLFIKAGIPFIVFKKTSLPFFSGQIAIINIYNLNISSQIIILLLISYLSNKKITLLSINLYIILCFFGLHGFLNKNSFFSDPTLGYLFGYLPASQICNAIASQSPKKISNIVKSCVFGLLYVHLVGVFYLLQISSTWGEWLTLVIKYSLLIYLPRHVVLTIYAILGAYFLQNFFFLNKKIQYVIK